MKASAASFEGYVRPDGRIGIRNHLLILPASAQVNNIAKRIARQVRGAVALQHPHGDDQLGEDASRTFEVLAGTGCNPNVGAVLVVGLGYEETSPVGLAERIAASGRQAVAVTTEAVGGTVRAIERGIELAREMAESLQRVQRARASLADLILGTNCGGSDTTSGLASNPALGVASDAVVAAGGTVLLSETTELIGAEHILLRRCVDKESGDRLLEIIERYELAVQEMGHDMRGGNPSPGNIRGGLTTIEEKSLGCIAKAGTSPIQGVIEYGEVAPGKGLYIMDTPGNDIESVSGMVAGGSQIVVFTTGRGTPTGNPIVPVIKVCGNPDTCRRMPDNIDLDASKILSGRATVEAVGEELTALMLEVAAGRRVKAEVLGHHEFSINRIGATA